MHNFENAVWMYVSPTCVAARDEFLKTMKKSQRIDEKNGRLSLREWLFRNGIRLFAPLL